MKKIFCTAAAALLFIHSPYVSAQSVTDGSVSVSGLDVARTEDNLFVSMDIDVSGLRLRSEREVVLTPVLVNGDDSLSLAPVLYAGRNRYFRHLRSGLPSADAALFRGGSVSVIEYRKAVPYLDWMGSSKLMLSVRTCGCCGESVSDETGFLSGLAFGPEIVPPFVYLSPAGEAVKRRVERGTAYIDFPVNRTEILEHYRENSSELQKIRCMIDRIGNDSDAGIISVTIKGHASPDGPWDSNAELAEKRTAALKEYVRGCYDFPDSLIRTSFVPEDWNGLEAYVSASSLPGRDGILKIIRGSQGPDAKEQAIKAAYPEDYARLLHEAYPSLRHSDYAVEYEVRTYTDTDEIVRLLKTRPQNLSLQEMYLAAGEMEPGSSEYNEVFEIAVRMFPDDEAANLNAANTAMSRGDMTKAGLYLSKAGDGAEAVYARGIHALLTGDKDKARSLFAVAAGRGITQAEDAIAALGQLN